MADVKLVIKIPEEEYRWIMKSDETVFANAASKECMLHAIKNGTPHENVTEFADRCRESGREKVLDKIRAEILEEKECAYADFERYKVDYLGQDWEDVYDSLPNDDFRYGMERCIEIIDKYKAESEVSDADSN